MPLTKVGDQTARRFSPLFEWIGRPIHVLWACRVPVASAVLGVVMLWNVPQAQDVFLDIANPFLSGFPAKIGFFAAVVAFWAAPLHYASRRILADKNWAVPKRFHRLPPDQQEAVLDEIDRHYGGWIVWIPRLLGIAPFVGIAGALRAARANIPAGLPDTPLVENVVGQIDTLWYINFAVGLAFAIYMLLRRPATRMIAGKGKRPEGAAATPFARRERDEAEDARHGREHEIGLALLLLLTLLFAIAFFWPTEIASWAPRAPLLALLFGGWIPALAFLSWLSHEWRAPVILLVIAVGSLATALIGDSHDVRVPREGEAAGGLRLEEAVAHWRAANPDCADPSTPCRPIIVAAAGGASRAGYFTASLLGHLIDATCEVEPAEGQGCRSADSLFVRRLFAISGVSGSSVGAAMLAAALVDSEGGPPPCSDKVGDHWFAARAVISWRDCAESLTAGDFLSATLVGLAFRDMFPLPGLGADRAVLLEWSWEEHYADVVDRDDADSKPAGLTRGFTTVAPEGCADGPPCPEWRPILVLNGASVETGRLILTTPIEPAYNIPGDRRDLKGAPQQERVFRNAHDFREMRDNRTGRNGGPCTDAIAGPDIALSTAALNSARFPLVSPAGNIRNACGQIVDRIVDGGYPESSGIITAAQLAQRLVEFNLFPIVLLVTNDPETIPDSAAERLARACPPGITDPAASGPACPDADDGQWGSFIRAPLSGLLATRGGRAELGAIEARELARVWAREYERRTGDHPADGNFIHVRVHAEPVDAAATDGAYRDVSMSWWLSNVVQAYLDAQLDDDRNVARLVLFCEGLGAGPDFAERCSDRIDPPEAR